MNMTNPVPSLSLVLRSPLQLQKEFNDLIPHNNNNNKASFEKGLRTVLFFQTNEKRDILL